MVSERTPYANQFYCLLVNLLCARKLRIDFAILRLSTQTTRIHVLVLRSIAAISLEYTLYPDSYRSAHIHSNEHTKHIVVAFLFSFRSLFRLVSLRLRKENC